MLPIESKETKMTSSEQPRVMSSAPTLLPWKSQTDEQRIAMFTKFRKAPRPEPILFDSIMHYLLTREIDDALAVPSALV